MKIVSLVVLLVALFAGCSTLSKTTFNGNVASLKFEYPIPQYSGASMMEDIKEKLSELTKKKGYTTYKVLSSSEGTESNVTLLGVLAAAAGGAAAGSSGQQYQARPAPMKEVIYLEVEFD